MSKTWVSTNIYRGKMTWTFIQKNPRMGKARSCSKNEDCKMCSGIIRAPLYRLGHCGWDKLVTGLLLFLSAPTQQFSGLFALPCHLLHPPFRPLKWLHSTRFWQRSTVVPCTAVKLLNIQIWLCVPITAMNRWWRTRLLEMFEPCFIFKLHFQTFDDAHPQT